ncbi:MAG: hypothetical protein ACK58T_25550 [Phycisphaerae bacterium]
MTVDWRPSRIGAVGGSARVVLTRRAPTETTAPAQASAAALLSCVVMTCVAGEPWV